MAVDMGWLGQEVLGKALNGEEQGLLQSLIDEKNFVSGEKIISMGQPGGMLYILRSGRANVEVHSGQEDRVTVAEASPGDLIGELTFLNNHPTTADVIATEDCVVYAVSRDDLTSIINKEQPKLAYLFFNAILEHQSGVIMEQRVTLAPELRKRRGKGMPTYVKVILLVAIAAIVYIIASS